MDSKFDRTAEDLGNIVFLEHVNVCVPDQNLATNFYVAALGLTRDPYMMTSTANMWVNIGRSQFHLPTRGTQLVRGSVGIVVPDRAALLERLGSARKRLGETRFDFKEHDGYVEATCPWGNRFRCHSPGKQFGAMTLGIAYVEFEVPMNSALSIAQFYKTGFCALAKVERINGVRHAIVTVGNNQHLVFHETDRPMPDYDGHHVQIYVNDFSAPYRFLKERGLVTEESSESQYRFQDIVDPDSGKVVFTVEHEVRSMKHPLFMRPLVNRNPAQDIMHYQPGRDAWV